MSFLFVDNITVLEPGRYVKGVKHITPHDQYLMPHPSGRLCFLPSLVGETLGQLAAWSVMAANHFTRRPVAGIVGAAYVHRPAFLGETLMLESVIDELDDTAVRYHSMAQINGEPVFSIEGAIGPLLPMDDFIALEAVRQQFEAIYHTPPINVVSLETQAVEPVPVGFDRILICEPGERLVAALDVNPQAPYFADHFPRRPVLPMTILLESKLALTRQFLQASGWDASFDIKGFRRIKMNEFVHPGDVVTTTLTVKKQTQDEKALGFLSEVSGCRVCVAELNIGIKTC